MQADLFGQQAYIFVKCGPIALHLFHGVKERQALEGQVFHAPRLDLKDGANFAATQDARRNLAVLRMLWIQTQLEFLEKVEVHIISIPACLFTWFQAGENSLVGRCRTGTAFSVSDPYRLAGARGAKASVGAQCFHEHALAGILACVGCCPPPPRSRRVAIIVSTVIWPSNAMTLPCILPQGWALDKGTLLISAPCAILGP